MASLGETASQCQCFRWPPWVTHSQHSLLQKVWENLHIYRGQVALNKSWGVFQGVFELLTTLVAYSSWKMENQGVTLTC